LIKKCTKQKEIKIREYFHRRRGISATYIPTPHDANTYTVTHLHVYGAFDESNKSSAKTVRDHCEIISLCS
jgi:hypothetical protein